MSLQSLAERLAETSLAETLTDSTWLFAAFEIVHVVAISLVLGSIALVDLRLVGIGPRDEPVAGLLRRLLPITWTGFAIALASGSVLIFANPIAYFGNFYFRGKVVLLALAGLNMVFFHVWASKRLDDPTAIAPRLSGWASLLIWGGVVSFGRWIGFTI